jgi:hypothetical protein
MTPRRLTRALGFDPSLLKYDPREPRESKGHGKESGEWVKLGDTGETSSATRPNGRKDGDGVSIAFLAPTLVRGASFLEAASPEIIAGLANLVARASVPTAVLGALLIPSNNSLIQEGEVPGLPAARYRFDQGMGVVWITTELDNRTFGVSAHRTQEGLLVDRQGHALGRFLSSGIYLDQDAVASAIGNALASDKNEKPGASSELSPHPDEPKVCPDPEPDHPHGSKEPALKYEEDVHERVNPILPLQRGQAV